MGANNFTAYGTGKTIGEAFHQATEQATWEYGHDPYSGTIGAKNGVANFGTAPGRATASKIEEIIHDLETYLDEGHYIEWTNNCKDCDETEHAHGWDATKLGHGFRRVTTKRRTDPRKRAGVTGAFVTERMVETYNDKWGPAVGFQLTGKALADYKARNNIPRGHKVYAFIGMAPS